MHLTTTTICDNVLVHCIRCLCTGPVLVRLLGRAVISSVYLQSIRLIKVMLVELYNLSNRAKVMKTFRISELTKRTNFEPPADFTACVKSDTS